MHGVGLTAEDTILCGSLQPATLVESLKSRVNFDLDRILDVERIVIKICHYSTNDPAEGRNTYLHAVFALPTSGVHLEWFT